MLEIFVVTMTALYWLPFMLAVGRGQERLIPIILANGLVGWTGVGWLIVLVWALRAPVPTRSQRRRAQLELVEG